MCLCVYLNVCICVHIYVYQYLCISLCVSVFACVCACVFLCVCVSLCHNACVEIREQLAKGVSSFLPSHGSWGLNYGFQAWQQMPLLTEISCQHNFQL